jgi:hypothetical protein
MIGAGVRGLAAMAAAGAILLLLPSAASAVHVGGATYTGPIQGGGTVEVDVSSDGTSITRFAVVDIPTSPIGGGVCPPTSSASSVTPIVIELLNPDNNTHWFSTFGGPSEGLGGVLDFDGYDDRHNEMSGRLAYRDSGCGNADPDGGFAGQNVHWRAQTGGGCFNSNAYTSAKS